MSIKWREKHIEIAPPKRTKKITGTRLGAILGANKWSTPFTTWCEITKTWEKPFVDTIYTRFGKVVEPKQAEFMRTMYGMSDLVTPEDKFGKDYFKFTHGDFYPDNKVFGGMWDYLLEEDGKPYAVLEMKTSKRVEDWLDDVPEYYSLQASLYAYLLGVDDVYMVATFTDDKDYEHPEDFVVTFENTKVIKFKVSEKYPNFKELLGQAIEFWDNHVLTGVSPEYDERKDKECLTALRELAPTGTLESLCEQYIALKGEYDALKLKCDSLKEQITECMSEQLTDSNNKCIVNVDGYTYTLTRTVSKTLDTKRLKEDGLYDAYANESVSERLTVKENK